MKLVMTSYRLGEMSGGFGDSKNLHSSIFLRGFSSENFAVELPPKPQSLASERTKERPGHV